MAEPQTRTSQRAIIEAAQADGSLDTLYWYMVVNLGGGKSAAAASHGVVPVVRVAPDPDVSYHYAHLMLEICKFFSGHLPVHLELTARDILEESNIAWIEFGDLDLVCPACAGVGWESCICEPTLWRTEETNGNHKA